MAQNSADNLEERENRLSEMEMSAALAFQKQQDEITKRAAALDVRERQLRDRAKELDAQVEVQENAFITQEVQISERAKAVLEKEKRLAANIKEFELQKQDLVESASSAPAKILDSKTPHEDPQNIRVLEEELLAQGNLFKAQLESSTANQRVEFDAQLRQALAQQESKFTTQFREVEKGSITTSQEVVKLRQELVDKSDEYSALCKREAALQAKILRMQERKTVETQQVVVDQADNSSEIPKTPVGPVFGNNSNLSKYLASADSKDLAVSLDRNMKDHNITIPQKLTIADSMKKNFSPEVLAKMEEVGQELEKRIAQRSTFAGKFRQKTGDYAAIVIHAFKKLFGKKVDDPNLRKACEEYNENSPNLEGEQAKNVGKFVAQVLTSKGGKINDVSTNL